MSLSRDKSEAVTTRTLAECEDVIEQGVREVGAALRAIRDESLYRPDYPTWDEYLRQRWGMDRSYAHRHIQAAEVVEMLPIGNAPPPPNESVARELSPLRREPEKLQSAWAQTVERHGEKPTALETREVVRDMSTVRSGDKSYALTPGRQTDVANVNKQRVWKVITTVDGLAESIDSINLAAALAVTDAAELDEMTRLLGKSLAELRRFRVSLEGRNA